MSFQSFDLTALSNILRDSERDQDSSDDDDVPVPGSQYQKYGPGQIGPKKKGAGDGSENQKADTPVSKKTEIWNKDEVSNDLAQAEVPLLDDPRKTPKYDMFYRQAVTSEDIFLQLGNKTPSSASCETLVVEISLPGEEDSSNIQLNLKDQALDLRSTIHFLYLPLPHPIDTKAGEAKWDQDKEKLVVALKLRRDLDGINF